MTERRYSDEEAAAIFKRAAEHQQQTSLPAAQAEPRAAFAEGMTLAELQVIGREVGIPPELVAQAATSMDRVGRPFVRRFLGLPIGVGRTVTLHRELSEAEWQQLVVDLRQTFDARGRLRDDGAFRQWTNGNLQALLEPARGGAGQQLRLKTLHSASLLYLNLGIGLMGLAGFLELGKVFAGGFTRNPAAPFTIALMGLGVFVFGALRLPSWARARKEQMQAIAERLTSELP